MNINTWNKMYINPKAKQRHQRRWMPQIGNVIVNKDGVIVGEITDINEATDRKGDHLRIEVRSNNGYERTFGKKNLPFVACFSSYEIALRNLRYSARHGGWINVQIQRTNV